MGVRGELFSTKVALQNRTYFFNVKENRLGDLYLNIVESKNRDDSGFDRQSVILFADDLQQFLRGFDDALRVLEKSVREKRRGGPKPPITSGAGPNKGASSNRGARPDTPRRTDSWPAASKKAFGTSESRDRPKWQDRASGEGGRSRRNESGKHGEAKRAHHAKERDSKERGTKERNAEWRNAETRYTEKRRNNTKGKEQNYSKSGPQKKRVVVRKRRDDSN